MCDDATTTLTPTAVFLRRIDQILQEKGWPRNMLTEPTGISESGLSRLFRGERELSYEEWLKINRFLGIDPPLYLGLASPSHNVKNVPVIGRIERGYVRLGGASVVYPHQETYIPVVPEREYRKLEQVSYEIWDDSAARVAPAGTYIITVEFSKLDDRNLYDGDEVVVRQQTTTHAGRNVITGYMDTVRIVAIQNGVILLKSASLQASESDDIIYDENDNSLEIKYLIIGKYQRSRSSIRHMRGIQAT